MTVEASAETAQSRAPDFYARVSDLHLSPLWRYGRELLPLAPATSAVPFVWRYETLRAALLEAGCLVTAEEAERRVLLLVNPGLDRVATTPTLLSAVQLLLPGEVARAHRHTATAVRFMVEGRGAHTVTDGERTDMEPGDLVMTPSWTWHDHESESAGPVLWLDGLDVPLVRAIEVGFFELHPDIRQELSRPTDQSKRRFLHATVRPRMSWDRSYSPVVNYPWSVTARALAGMSEDAEARADMLTLDYVNPLTGGPVTATIACRAHMLLPGQASSPRRETASSIFHVVRGEGASIVGDTELTWAEKDVLVVPAWAEASHVNLSSTEPALLFSLSDEPALAALGLYRAAP